MNNIITKTLTPYIDQMRSRFDMMPTRNQQVLVALSLFLAVILFWFMVWKPVGEWEETAHKNMMMERETHAFLAANYSRAKALVKASSSAPKKDPASVISSTGRKAGLDLTRVQPARQGVSVWLDEAPYQKLLAWLVNMQNKESLAVKQIRIEPTDEPGMVKVFLRLSR